MRKNLAALLLYLPFLAQPVEDALAADSVYTTLNFDKGCQWEKAKSEEEEAMFASAVCKGYKDYAVYFSEDDLRQSVAFGEVADTGFFPGGFAEFNYVGQTIEWRVENEIPYATILRWHIANNNDDTGEADKKNEGQILVISRVALASQPVADRKSCMVGLVDALANKNANELARKIADEKAKNYDCENSRLAFYGVRGPLSGTPHNLDE